MTLRVGIDVDVAGLSAALKTFPGIATARVFFPPGKGTPTWTNSMVAQLRKAGVVVHVSFKDWIGDAEVKAAIVMWLDSMPADVKEVILTWHHEPEGDQMDSHEYRRRYVFLRSILDAHKNGGRVKLYPIHTWYPSTYKIGDNFSTDWTTWVGVWQQWVPLDAGRKYAGHAMSFDCYVPVTSTKYPKPEDFFRIPVGAAHIVGVPLAISELGSLKVSSDKTGSGRAQWITDCYQYLRGVDAVQMNWWHTTGTGGFDYRLDDKPSIAAWNKIIAASKVL